MFKNNKTKFFKKIPEEVINFDSLCDETLLVRVFIIKDFSEIHSMINILNKGKIIALISIKTQPDSERIIKLLKAWNSTIKGDIAFFWEWIVLTPYYVKIYKMKS